MPEHGAVIADSGPGAVRVARENRILLACGLAWATSLIHLQAAIDHTSEYWLYALFFILLAVSQFAWGFALYRWPSRRLALVGALGSLAVIGLWIASRTAGLPIGPDYGAPETVGALDAIATADEVALALLLALPLVRLPPAAGALMRAVALLLLLLSSMVLAGGFHAH